MSKFYKPSVGLTSLVKKIRQVHNTHSHWSVQQVAAHVGCIDSLVREMAQYEKWVIFDDGSNFTPTEEGCRPISEDETEAMGVK